MGNFAFHRRRDPGEPVQAVILAAGNGSRLNGEIGHRPKCLAEVGGRTLLAHQLDALRRAGITSVIVVAGFEHRQVEDALGGVARVIVNDRYASTNSMYSFLLAADAIVDGVVVLNCDVLFPSRLLTDLCSRPGSVVSFDSSSGHDPEHMKVAVEAGALVEMSKRLPPHRTAGENLGVLRLDRDVTLSVLAAARELVEEGGEREWLAAAVNRAVHHHRIAVMDVAGVPWVEIDFPEDLHRARTQAWPAIVQHERWASAATADDSPPVASLT